MASGFPIAVVLEDQLRLDDQPSFREAVSWPSSAMAVDRAGQPASGCGAFINGALALSLCSLLIASHRVSRPTWHQLPAAMQAAGPQSAAWRMALLRQFHLEDHPLDRVHQPVLILASGADRLLPSPREEKRLACFIPSTTIVCLPDSGHVCLLEHQLN
jgi:pimeloyl-ACP methyl ester carboxylesterase